MHGLSDKDKVRAYFDLYQLNQASKIFRSLQFHRLRSVGLIPWNRFGENLSSPNCCVFYQGLRSDHHWIRLGQDFTVIHWEEMAALKNPLVFLRNSILQPLFGPEEILIIRNPLEILCAFVKKFWVDI